MKRIVSDLIICPYCEFEHTPEDYGEWQEYWQYPGPQDFKCYHCSQTFLIEEGISIVFLTSTKEERKKGMEA